MNSHSLLGMERCSTVHHLTQHTSTMAVRMILVAILQDVVRHPSPLQASRDHLLAAEMGIHVHIVDINCKPRQEDTHLWKLVPELKARILMIAHLRAVAIVAMRESTENAGGTRI